jgi:hypothetical protein
MGQLTLDDIDFLIEAVTVWERSDITDFLLGESINSVFSRGKAEFEILEAQEKTRKQLQELMQQGKVRNERAVLVKATLIKMKKNRCLMIIRIF